MIQVTALENGLTRVLDLGSKLWALYDSDSGVFHTGFYFAELLEDIPGIERVIEQTELAGLEGAQNLEHLPSSLPTPETASSRILDPFTAREDGSR